MERDQIRSFKDLGSVSKELDQQIEPREVVDAKMVEIASLRPKPEPEDGVIVILSTKTNPPLATLWDRHRLLEFAKEILRTYEPTVEDRILDALNEIKTRLPEPPPKGN